MTNNTHSHQTTYILIGLAALATGMVALWLSHKRTADTTDTPTDSATITPTKSNRSAASSAATDSVTTGTTEKSLHRRIEEIDRRGKQLFKEKKYTEAAECFSSAMELIKGEEGDKNGSTLDRQWITLVNNRSAMYEKASLPDLALADCDAVLELDPSHVKARLRCLRILESLHRHTEALTQVCALQLKYMHDNRDKIRLGLPPAGPPPVPQSKIEELVLQILPLEVSEVQQKQKNSNDMVLPSKYTIDQLLKSFSGYHRWMGEAAKSGTVDSFTVQLQQLKPIDTEDEANFIERICTESSLLYQRGRRYAFEKQYERAVSDFDKALELITREEMREKIANFMDTKEYVRIYEWGGMCRHLRYDLKGAEQCYDKCLEIEPNNTELIVKKAGVKMDSLQHKDAEQLFARALTLNPSASDALLHRANLRMLQQQPSDAEEDLQMCIRLYPNNLLARLRLATVLMAKEDMGGAKQLLDEAAEYDPDSSEVYCYRGELHFARGEFDEAKLEFEMAMKCDESNPTPYVNSALAIMNTPPSVGSMPDFTGAITLLEKAIQVDPMFHSAYVQLGQMKLSIATDLTKAQEVVGLYNRGLKYCRTEDELKDICSMRILTVAQIEAAKALHMETLNMQ